MTFSIIHFVQYITRKVVEKKKERNVGNSDVYKQLHGANMVVRGWYKWEDLNLLHGKA